MVIKVDRAKLVAARYTQGLTVKALAMKSGVSFQTIFTTESGVSTPSPTTLAKLCKVLKVKPGDVLDVRELEA